MFPTQLTFHKNYIGPRFASVPSSLFPGWGTSGLHLALQDKLFYDKLCNTVLSYTDSLVTKVVPIRHEILSDPKLLLDSLDDALHYTIETLNGHDFKLLVAVLQDNFGLEQENPSPQFFTARAYIPDGLRVTNEIDRVVLHVRWYRKDTQDDSHSLWIDPAC